MHRQETIIGQAGNNQRTGRKQLQDRQETIIGQAGNNYRTGRKQLQDRQETIIGQAGNNYRTGRKQSQNRQETITGQAGNNHRTGRKQLQDRQETILGQAGNNYKTGRQQYRQVEPAGGGGLNKVKGTGRTAKRRKGKLGQTVGGRCISPYSSLSCPAWKPGIPRGKVNLEYDRMIQTGRKYRLWEPCTERRDRKAWRRDRHKDGAQRGQAGAQTGLTGRAIQDGRRDRIIVLTHIRRRRNGNFCRTAGRQTGIPFPDSPADRWDRPRDRKAAQRGLLCRAVRQADTL